MDPRLSSERVKTALRFAPANPRYSTTSRTGPSPPQPPPHALPSVQRPRGRMRRLPETTRHEGASAYEVDSAVAVTAGFNFDDDEGLLDDELKLEFDRSAMTHRRPQRVKYVKFKTRVQPDILVPYLYRGDCRSRINAIIERTGCTIDYCPESPDDEIHDGVSPPQRGLGQYMMSFLVAAETSAQLEAASRLLRVLVDRVQQYVENKMAAAASMRRSGDVQDTAVSQQGNMHDSPGAGSGSSHTEADSCSPQFLKSEAQGGVDGHGVEYAVGNAKGAPARPLRAVDVQLRTRLDERWHEEDEEDINSAWIGHQQMPPQRIRGRQYDARYQRPVYRRILVDEDGYEVYPPPVYDHVRRLTPRLALAAASPPPARQRRRFSDASQPYHAGLASSDDDDLMQPTAPRAVAARQPRGSYHDEDHHHHHAHVRSEITVEPPRRGTKRRLEVHEHSMGYSRYRQIAASEQAVYDFGSDGDDEVLILSGDEFFDDEYDGHRSMGQARAGRHLAAAGQENQGSRGRSNSDVAHPQEMVHLFDDTRSDFQATLSSEKIQPGDDQVSMGNDPHELHKPVEETTVDTAGPPQELTEDANTSVDTKISVPVMSTERKDCEMADADSEPESETATAQTAVMPHVVVPSHVASCVPDNEPVESFGSSNESSGIVGIPECASPGSKDTTPEVGDMTTTNSMPSEQMEANAPIVEEAAPRTEDVAQQEQAELTHAEQTAAVVRLQDTNSQAPSQPIGFGSARKQLNDSMIHLLQADSQRETNHSKSTLAPRVLAASHRVAVLENESFWLEQLRVLVSAAIAIESELWQQKSVPLETKQTLSTMRQAVTQVESDSCKSTEERVAALQTALFDFISTELPRFDATEDASAKTPEEIKSTTTLQQAAVEKISPPAAQITLPPMATLRSCESKRNVRVTTEKKSSGSTPLIKALTAKTETELAAAIPPLSIPVETPSFVSGLVRQLEQSVGLSSAMASSQRRLLREINKSDPYYYLHSMQWADVSGRQSSKPTHSCPFGCAASSAHKWERKVVSQISSRMKWFDSVAYALAKVSGGKELLSRKKMNSTIRKLHLVALQLHCLIVHLYCLRKRVVCREMDSLPTALNNSYYEKRMNGYKSRLRLTVHQPPPPQGSGTSTAAAPGSSPGVALPPDELLRDTFEFFPELLLCVDMWGFECRRERNTVDGSPRIPTEYLQRMATQAFDFDSDANGLLQGICEELLNILCLWNEFKWGESLESLTADQILAFEAKVKASISKIVEAHANHLVAQWAARLTEQPQMLHNVRLTQSNVYYTEQAVAVMSTAASTSEAVDRKNNDLVHQGDEDDEDDEELMVHDFWRTRFVSTTSSSSSSEDGKSTVKPTAEPALNLEPLRLEDLARAADSHQQTESKRLTWSDVYDMRQQCLSLSASTRSLLVENQQALADTGTNGGLSTSDDGVNALLMRLSRARNLVEDAVRTSEKLALHSVGLQLGAMDADDKELLAGAGSLADIESMSDGDERCDDDMEDVDDDEDDEAIVNALLSTGKTKREDPVEARPHSNKVDGEVEPNEEEERSNEEEPWKQPEIKDLLEIVSSTNSEMAEICSQRARSARVRDKLQAQSLDLARQSIQIFQTILKVKQ